jgi:hypothetical protein
MFLARVDAFVAENSSPPDLDALSVAFRVRPLQVASSDLQKFAAVFRMLVALSGEATPRSLQ